jgi:uncharacterized protein (DUF2126 family)
MLTQDYSGSRLVDASTARLEISLRTQGDGDLSAWSLSVDGYRLPLHFEEDEQGPVLLFALRYRRYKPWHGLHPALDAHGPIEMILANFYYHSALKITYYEWKPQGGGYAGLPQDLDEARRRHEERLVVERLATIPDGKGAPPVSALTPYCLDLRRL